MAAAYDVDVGGTIELCNGVEAPEIYWRNDFGHDIYLRELRVWQGVSRHAIADVLFQVWLVRNELDDVSCIHKGSWDHYAEPTDPGHILTKTYNPHYVLMPPKAYMVFRRRGAALDPANYDKTWHHQVLYFWYTLEP